MVDAGSILVGTDGSSRARFAVLEAARIAHSYGRTLRVLSAYSPLFTILAYDPEPPKEEIDRIEALLANSRRLIHESYPDLNVETSWVLGEPDQALIEASSEVELVVVGARGQGAVHRMLVGSVATKVATQAACPTFVVRDGAFNREGPITVGLGPEETSIYALEVGFQLAKAEGTSVHAVRAHQHSAAGVSNIPEGQRKDWMVGEIEKSVDITRRYFDDVQARYPDVPGEFIHIQAHATDCLIDAAEKSRLLIVAPNGVSTTNRALGSVALAVLHHAPAVLIAR
ncbi:MAG: universal stress protein [Flaviflexus sp.]|uniref:universal stress protein n=1 Tax=Flaviflexus sp. TaxID=1969482 RepID=UPI00352EAA76